MTTQDSGSAFSGQMAATLTAHIRQVPVPRTEQSSGFFDLQSLAAARVQRMAPQSLESTVPMPSRPGVGPLVPMRQQMPASLDGTVATSARPYFPPLPVPPARNPYFPSAPPGNTYAPPIAAPMTAPSAYTPILHAPVVRALPARKVQTWQDEVRRAARPQPIGWFAVFAMWLATSTLAVLAATHVPGHVGGRARSVVATAPVPAPPSPAPTAPAPVPANDPARAVAAPPPPTPLPAAATTPASTGTVAELSINDLPRVGAAPVATPRPAPAPRPAPSPRAVAVAVAAEPKPAPQPRPAPVAPPPAPRPAVVAAPAPAPASNPLDDLIRKEVAAEQKRTHGAGAAR